MNDDFEMHPTREGKDLMVRWLEARDARERADREASRARCEQENSEIELGKWMLPSDAQPGEKVLMWCRDALIQAEKVDLNRSRVTVRTPGKVVPR